MTLQETVRPAAVAASDARDYATLRFCLWSVVVYSVVGLLGFAVFAGFFPPPGADLSPAQIGDYFREHDTGIRIGMALMAASGPFYFVWSAVLSKIITKIEGPMGPLSTIELIGGLFTAIVTFLPAVIWVTAAFHIESRSDATISMLYDFGWFFLDITFFCTFLQQVAFGVAVLRDHRTTPLFPRWIAWFAFLTSAVYVPLCLLPFMHTGPFAWQGLMNFWAVFGMFFGLLAAITVYAYKALHRLEQEDAVA